MKAVSEFAGHILTKGIAAKTALTAEGKSEEEITTSLGETFKFKDNRLKYYMVALGVAEDNLEKLYRVRVFKFEEGDDIPEKAVEIEEVHYIPEFFTGPKAAKAVVTTKDLKAGNKGKGGKGGGKKGPKPSPWGESPEEAAAKKAARIKNQQAAAKS